MGSTGVNSTLFYACDAHRPRGAEPNSETATGAEPSSRQSRTSSTNALDATRLRRGDDAMRRPSAMVGEYEMIRDRHLLTLSVIPASTLTRFPNVELRFRTARFDDQHGSAAERAATPQVGGTRPAAWLRDISPAVVLLGRPAHWRVALAPRLCHAD